MKMTSKKTKVNVMKNYRFLIILIFSMILGAAFGFICPKYARELNFLGTIFINMMFCMVVPLVFSSIASTIANMKSRNRASKIIGVTIATFVITGVIASIIMFALVKFYPPVLKAWQSVEVEEMGEHATIRQLIVNFFTANDFVGLLSRRSMLPLIVFSALFGLSVNLTEGANGTVGKWLKSLSTIMLKFINLVTYYAPIAFFAIFAGLVADYGTMITEAYGRALILYYPLCFIYLVTAFPLYAWFGGGKGAVRIMAKNIIKPAIVSLGTCSSIATIPANVEACEETGISKDVSDMVMPLGATMHMDGSCFSSVLKVAFVYGVLGQTLTWANLPMIILVSVLSSVGMSGVPGGGYIAEYIICTIFFADKMELAFPILVAIGNLVDPPATMINAAGDYVVSFIVSRYADGKDWLRKISLKKIKIKK